MTVSPLRILVTGGGGQVGSEVAAHLPHHQVIVLDRAACDLSDRHSVEQAVAAAAPAAVVNCAAWTDVDGCEADPERAVLVNALGVRHLAAACARAGAHLVHVSTDYVFSGDKAGPYDEWDEPSPRSVYGRSKLGGELELARHAGSWAVARTSWVFGRRGRNFVDTIVDRARQGAPLRVVDDQRGCPTYAPDLAGALARLAVGRLPGVYHVTNQGPCTWHDLAAAAVELAGLDPSVVGTMTTAELGRPAPRPANSVLSGAAWAAAGLPPLRPWREALAEKMTSAVPAGGQS
ncbi:MAG: dTDP-4-dehydrorhamnose reductase [Actinomycetota bacterium]|jgi:dTDP-4-dehydrorhamnose reductase|nr:dTDP-4-dehydrorhamnose reductase [Actinomycetota bacterium]MDQ1504023.1 dTDP-4-dehydrorhamnose reductase [Actinomycetota bacterium]